IVDPFNLDYLSLIFVNSKNDLLSLTTDSINIINFIKSNYINLLNLLLQPNYDRTFLNLKLRKAYLDIFRFIDQNTVVRSNQKMFRGAAELLKLQQINGILTNNIYKFIYRKAAIIMNKINIKVKLEALNNIKYMIDSLPLPTLTNIVKQTINEVNNLFIPIGALVMDAYLLARMFLYENDIIVYAGASHID